MTKKFNQFGHKMSENINTAVAEKFNTNRRQMTKISQQQK